MNLNHNEEPSFSLTRFESMLKTNAVLFFDSEEFEDIIGYYLDNGKIAMAKKATKLGLEQHPTSVNLKLFQVEMYIFEDKLDTAEQLLNDLEEIEKYNEEIFIQKANIYSRRDHHEKAIEFLNIALDITEDKADVWNLLGMEYLFMDDYEHSMYYFMKCMEEDAEDYASLYNVIYCFECLGQHREAIDYLNVFLNSNPYSEVAWHQVGKQYYALKEYERAIAAFDFAIISDDTFVGAYFEKAKVLERLKRYHEAIENYLITIDLDQPTSFALLRTGKCYEKLGNTDLALQFYFKCVEEDVLLDKGWIAITDYYFKRKNYQKALYYIDKALNIDNENLRYWKRYGEINLKLKLYEEAEVGFRKAIENGSLDFQVWIMRADVLHELGEYNAAINHLKQAMEYFSDNAEIEYRLTGLYYSTRETTKAEYHLQNALKLDFDSNIILEVFFPLVYEQNAVQKLIKKFRK
ncbi:MAG TPA: tetratricopeptide repeat protein [Flavobacteriaceae bacterium]|nr:tetratricopeptide repeat protein [Flavobacteriaceae bacterium]